VTIVLADKFRTTKLLSVSTFALFFIFIIIYCPCKIGEQTTDHILYDCDLVKQERDKVKAEILRTKNWPVRKDTLINKYTKMFNKFVDSIHFENL